MYTLHVIDIQWGCGPWVETCFAVCMINESNMSIEYKTITLHSFVVKRHLDLKIIILYGKIKACNINSVLLQRFHI